MHRLVTLTALSLLISLSATRGGTQIEDCSKCCQLTVPAKAGVGPYISVFGGANVHQSGDLDSGFFDWDLQSKTGWFAGLKVGYAFNTNSIFLPAVELEGFYNRVDFEEKDKEVERFGDEFYRYKRETTFKETSDVHVAAIMLNGVMRFDLGRFRPYIGGGIGVAHIWFQETKFEFKSREDFRFDDIAGYGGGFSGSYKSTFTNSHRDLREWSFAAQGIAGLEFEVTDRIGIYAEYKALWLRDAVQVSDYVNHLVGGGVRFYF